VLRQVRPDLRDRAAQIEVQLEGCVFDRDHGIALILLGVEVLERAGFGLPAINVLFEQMMAVPTEVDPRTDTRGT
jgi:hypothetical protein